MTVTYNAILYSNNKLIDKLPVTLRARAPITSGTRFRSVDPLCGNATEMEAKWYREQVEPCIVKEGK